MLLALGIPVSIGKPEVDHIDVVVPFTHTNQKILRLDVAMDEPTRMELLQSDKLRSSPTKSYGI
jgi:hypothetical protein